MSKLKKIIIYCHFFTSTVSLQQWIPPSPINYSNCTQVKSLTGTPTLPRELFCQFAQAAEAVCSQLTEDAGKHLCQLLGLSVASDGEGVGGQRGLNFRVVEVDHGPVIFDHVHLRGQDHFSLFFFRKALTFLKVSRICMQITNQQILKNFPKGLILQGYNTGKALLNYLLNSSNIVHS